MAMSVPKTSSIGRLDISKAKVLLKRRRMLDARKPEPSPLWDNRVAKTRCLCGQMVVYDKVESEDQISGTCTECKAKAVLKFNGSRKWVSYDSF